MQLIANTIEVTKRARYELAMLTQKTGAATLIELAIETHAERGIEARSFHACGAIPQHAVALEKQLTRNFPWKRITQTERDEVGRVVDLPVGQAAAGTGLDDSS